MFDPSRTLSPTNFYPEYCLMSDIPPPLYSRLTILTKIFNIYVIIVVLMTITWFQEGETIILLNRVDENWFEGSTNGRTGYFPVSYVQVVVALP